MKPAWLSAVATFLAFGAIPTSAQMVVAAKSGVVNYTEGAVLLNNQLVESTVTHYPDIKENGVLKTTEGRAEILLTPGVVMRLGENSSVKLITNRLIDTRLELVSGSAVIEADQITKDTRVTIVAGEGATSLVKAGIYRFDAEPARVKVFRGDAVVEAAGVSTPVGSGRMLALESGNQAIEKFNTQDTDALDHWSSRRGEYMAIANVSAAKSMSAGFSPTGCVSSWRFNSWLGMNAFVPCSGYFTSPYGYGIWSPMSVNQLYWGGYGFNRGGFGGGGAPAAAGPVGPVGRQSPESFGAPTRASSDSGSAPMANAGASHSGGFSSGPAGGSAGGHGGGAVGGGGGGRGAR